MGCVVNGPGEARDADVGLAAGNAKGVIFRKGKIVRTVPETEMVVALKAEILQVVEDRRNGVVEEPTELGRYRPMLSLTAQRIRCLQPGSGSVGWTETWPNGNWICSSSPPAAWQSLAQVRLLSRSPHSRRTCARPCDVAGGELDQIQFLLGHVSSQATERYLGCKQKLRGAVNDRLGIEPDENR